MTVPRPLRSLKDALARTAGALRSVFPARRAGPDPADLAPDSPIRFRCNLCGAPNGALLKALSRETPSCWRCRSNVRFRAIAHLVVTELLGRPLPLHEVPERRDLAGLGLTDAAAYATPLAAKFAYTNTYFHAEPRLDIAAVGPEHFGRYDFVIASDVFEHVAPPVGRAFANARRMLKPGGRFVFTVPFSLEPDTVEHFPELNDWSIEGEGESRALVNRTTDGRVQRFDRLVFHGGDGATLEMRLFSRDALLAEFERAGFSRARLAAEPYLPFGILWPEPWSVPMVAYA